MSASEDDEVKVRHLIHSAVRSSGLDEGLCTVMIQHTSASLTIQEHRARGSTRRCVLHLGS